MSKDRDLNDVKGFLGTAGFGIGSADAILGELRYQELFYGHVSTCQCASC